MSRGLKSVAIKTPERQGSWDQRHHECKGDTGAVPKEGWQGKPGRIKPKPEHQVVTLPSRLSWKKDYNFWLIHDNIRSVILEVSQQSRPVFSLLKSRTFFFFFQVIHNTPHLTRAPWPNSLGKKYQLKSHSLSHLHTIRAHKHAVKVISLTPPVSMIPELGVFREKKEAQDRQCHSRKWRKSLILWRRRKGLAELHLNACSVIC